MAVSRKAWRSRARACRRMAARAADRKFAFMLRELAQECDARAAGNQRQARKQAAAPAGSFELWLERSLHARFDLVARAPLPRCILAEMNPPPAGIPDCMPQAFLAAATRVRLAESRRRLRGSREAVIASCLAVARSWRRMQRIANPAPIA